MTQAGAAAWPLRTRWIRTRLGERGGFVVLTLAIIAFYVFMRAPVLNPPSFIDPWIYTASFVNYHYVLTAFPAAYYPARLPWILPGIVVNDFLSPVPAFFVLHLAFFLGSGLFAYLLVRRFFGRGVAFVSYSALMLSPLCFDAYATDYPDGAIITYVFGAAFFGLGAWGSRRRTLRMGLAGFCLAGAVGINLFAAFLAIGIVLLYLIVFHVEERFVRRLPLDAVAASFGALVMLVVCGTFSKVEGGAFLFFMRQVREVQTLNGANYKPHGYGWLKSQPQLLLPPFLLIALLLSIPKGAFRQWRSDIAVRFAIGAGAFLGFFTLVVAVWEFAYTAAFLETYYYFSLFVVAMSFVLAAVIFFVGRRVIEGERARIEVVIALATLVIAAPIFVLYRLHSASFGTQASIVCLYLMVFFAAAVLGERLFRSLRRPAIAGAAAVLLLGGVGYAEAGGTITANVFSSSPSTFKDRREVLAVAMQLIAYVKSLGLQTAPPGYSLAQTAPGFWYDQSWDPALIGIQSTYLWGDTLIGLPMPEFSSSTRAVLEQRRPPHLVLLCLHRSCSGARGVLRRAGYANTVIGEKLLVSGEQRVWAIALALSKFAPLDADGRYYQPTQSAFASTVKGRTVVSWAFTSGVPDGWGGSAVRVARKAHGESFMTTPRQWDYELNSGKLTLQPGVYRASLSGRVDAGGLDLGVLDASSEQWIAQSFYWYRQQGFSGWMTTQFTLTTSTPIKVVLSNWVPTTTRASRWAVRELVLTRIRS